MTKLSKTSSSNEPSNMRRKPNKEIEKGFLQVRIKGEERDALRFYWKAPGSEVAAVYWFTRTLFGLMFPFFIRGCSQRTSSLVDAEEVGEKKVKALKVFEDGAFKLHKWHLNAVKLEGNEKKSTDMGNDNDET